MKSMYHVPAKSEDHAINADRIDSCCDVSECDVILESPGFAWMTVEIQS